MTLDDLPEYRATVEAFEKAGSDLLAAMEQYGTHGIEAFDARQSLNIGQAVVAARQVLGTQVD